MIEPTKSSGLNLEPASAMGFPALEPVTSLQSVAHLFGSTKNRCGIYFLAFQSGLFHVGQAVDVVRRFSQHRRNHDDIVGFSFIAVSKPELNDIERTLIFKAESLGLKITNAAHVTSIVGDTDFDLVVPLAEQDAWLSSPTRAAISDKSDARIVLPDAQQVRFSKQLPQPQRVWFLMAGVGTTDDFDFLDNADAASESNWRGHRDARRGDVAVVWCARPPTSRNNPLCRSSMRSVPTLPKVGLDMSNW